jgi:NAD-dependent dihydropyrimidine dehydrogenase PreA subunit
MNNIINRIMKRDILKIEEDLCNGCGKCVPNCHEGALQVIDGKVRLVSELMCDGLGACIGHCPEGAITIESREAEPYNEVKVIELMKEKGKNTVTAPLKHLKEHGEIGYLKEGVGYLMEHRSKLGFELDEVIHEVHNQGKSGFAVAAPVQKIVAHNHNSGGCPGSRAMVIERDIEPVGNAESVKSELRQWPVQMHLINPNAPYFRNADLLVAADCVAYSVGGFHDRFLKGKSLVIACPKLDQGLEIYVEKLKTLIDTANVNTITVMIMEVPCCGGLLQMVRTASAAASRKVPVKLMVTAISGDIMKEECVYWCRAQGSGRRAHKTKDKSSKTKV